MVLYNYVGKTSNILGVIQVDLSIGLTSRPTLFMVIKSNTCHYWGLGNNRTRMPLLKEKGRHHHQILFIPIRRKGEIVDKNLKESGVHKEVNVCVWIWIGLGTK